MVAAGGNRNANNMTEGPNGRPWSYKLLDCGGHKGLCECGPPHHTILTPELAAGLEAFCFPCSVYGSIQKRYDHLAAHGTPHPHGGDDDYCSSDCSYYCVVAQCFGWWIPEASGSRDCDDACVYLELFNRWIFVVMSANATTSPEARWGIVVQPFGAHRVNSFK
jgi:hypothetical protein